MNFNKKIKNRKRAESIVGQSKSGFLLKGDNSLKNIGVSKNITPLWFIGYVFLTLGIFSGGTLYFSTRG